MSHASLADKHFADGFAKGQEAARSTIAELEKRIGELEAEQDYLFDGLGDLNGWRNPRAKLDAIVEAGLEANDALEAAEQALTAERQRIAELEAERDEARHQYARAEVQATEYHNRMQDAIAERDEALREHTDMMWQRRRAEEEADAERLRRESAKSALEQIVAVCTDNAKLSCDHRLALDFVRQVASKATASDSEEMGG